MLTSRAYSLLDVKAVDPERRIITGTATSPTPDRVGDILEPLGVSYHNPLPLLLHHDQKQPVGVVVFKTPTKHGIEFEARMPLVDEPPSLKDRVDVAWSSIKAGLIRGVSIGYRTIDQSFNKETGGYRVLKSEVLELSLVTIPANADATIASLKSYDLDRPAAPGPNRSGIKIYPPGAAGSLTGRAMKLTYSEQLTNLEHTIAAKVTEREAIQAKASDDGRAKNDDEKTSFDTLTTEIKGLESERDDIRVLESTMRTAAKPVAASNPAQASESRGGSVISIKSNLAPGTAFTRYAMALAASRGSRFEAAEYAKRWDKDTPEVSMVLKAAMTAGTVADSDWAAPLVVYRNMANEFVELLRPATIIGQIPGMRRVPFNITMPTQTQGATVGWVGEGKPKPVSELKFGQISLGMSKAAGIIVISEELARASEPSAEAIVRQDLIAAMAQFLDLQFIDPAVAAVANVSPASITNGVTPITASGATAAAFRTDFQTIAAQFTAANLSLRGAVWIMNETQALAFATAQNPLGQPAFEGTTATGGTLMGLPVVASEAVPGNYIILVKASEILLADDGGVTLDASREASLQMDSAPASPADATTVMVSLWQLNLVGLRAERYINWKKRNAAAVSMLNGVYTGA